MTAHDFQLLIDENTQLRQDNRALKQSLQVIEQQLDWFKRQLFGSKSERHIPAPDPKQGDLFAHLEEEVETSADNHSATTVKSYQRKKKPRGDSVLDKGLRFDKSVPVRVIDCTPASFKNDQADDVSILHYESTFRLAQRPGSYLILEYRTPVYKEKGSDAIHQLPAPPNVLDRTIVDVSFLAGMLVDKFAYHLPLYRQHQRLKEAGITVARSSLSTWCMRAAALLEPIVEAQHRSILSSDVLGMDEVPIKAGKGKGKMKQGYLWPQYGDQDEVHFHYSPSRGHQVIKDQLDPHFKGVLLCDGYSAYQLYSENNEAVTLANCWAHTRRHFENVKKIDPIASEQALAIIKALYHQEQLIKDQQLEGQDKLDHRTQHSEPIVKQFWQWCDQQKQRAGLFPKHPLMKALNYALARVEPLQVFLSEPNVPLDTNHVERSLRVIPMGRKNWLFCWSELGAKQVATMQSLIVTCRLQGVHPYRYLVDVLQRIQTHPNSRIEELTPRLWKEHFADCPMISDAMTEVYDGVE